MQDNCDYIFGYTTRIDHYYRPLPERLDLRKLAKGRTPGEDIALVFQRLAIWFLRKTGVAGPAQEEVSTLVREKIRTGDFSTMVLEQYREAFKNLNREPKTLYIGSEDFERLMNTAKSTYYMNFTAPIAYGYEDGSCKFYGLEVHVIPWMSGVLVVP